MARSGALKSRWTKCRRGTKGALRDSSGTTGEERGGGGGGGEEEIYYTHTYIHAYIHTYIYTYSVMIMKSKYVCILQTAPPADTGARSALLSGCRDIRHHFLRQPDPHHARRPWGDSNFCQSIALQIHWNLIFCQHLQIRCNRG